jgi:energy-coupling factor transport system substrate-specific component
MTAPDSDRAAEPSNRWRVVDLVTVSVLGSTFGVVYWAWNQLWLLTTPFFLFFPPAQAIGYGVWMLPQVMAVMLVRRRGAAVFGSMSAVIVSAFLGNVFGLTVLLYGVVQGGLTELVFAVSRYRFFNWFTAGLGTGLAAAGGTTLDVVLYYPFWTIGWKLAYIAIGGCGSFLLGALLAPFVVRRLASAGALDGLPAGRFASQVDEAALPTVAAHQQPGGDR